MYTIFHWRRGAYDTLIPNKSGDSCVIRHLATNVLETGHQVDPAQVIIVRCSFRNYNGASGCRGTVAGRVKNRLNENGLDMTHSAASSFVAAAARWGHTDASEFIRSRNEDDAESATARMLRASDSRGAVALF